MGQVADSSEGVALNERDDAVETRVWRSMVIAVTIAVFMSAMLAPWRVTTGLILGGSLSLLNYRWLHTSVAAILNVDLTSQRPRASVLRYILRYLVVGGIVFAAYNLELVSLAATIAGLCSFVPALLIEAGREFYLAIIHREESF
jgi:hypothetical protein